MVHAGPALHPVLLFIFYCAALELFTALAPARDFLVVVPVLLLELLAVRRFFTTCLTPRMEAVVTLCRTVCRGKALGHFTLEQYSLILPPRSRCSTM